MKPKPARHQAALPKARGIRRACRNELYRTIKRLDIWVAPEKLSKAEELYAKRVVLNLPWIAEHQSNRRALADWFDANCAADIAALWEVDRERLSEAFRSAFGG